MAISHKPGTVFNSPETQQWAVHGQPTCPISVSLFGTEFLTHFLSYKHPSIISHTHSPTRFWTVTDSQKLSKIPTISVPCFRVDQAAHSRPLSYQACILMQNFQNLKTETAPNFMGSHSQHRKSQRNSNNSVPCFGTDQTAPQGLKPTETSKNP